MRRFLAAALLLGLALPALALDTQTRVVGPVRSWDASDLTRFDPSWLHVKFVEGADVEIDGAGFADAQGPDLNEVNAALRPERGIAIRRTFSGDRATLRARKAVGEARSRMTGPDLSLWFDVRVGGGRAAVARLINALNACAAVEIAHPAPIAEPAYLSSAGAIAPAHDPERTPDFTGQQGYLYDPPAGLDAPAAWATTGGRGEGLHFIDVELAWCENHEDFDFTHCFFQGGAPQDPSYEDHGTAVLGEIVGQPNTFGVTGFASAVQYGVEAISISEWPNVPNRFQDAVDHLSAGDVWLIELQMYPPGRSATPMEWVQVNYDVIWTSVWSLGIVCMEAGANGTQNLDDPSWGGVFDRRVRDSGAILVAAGTPYGRVAEYFTNWGSRMDAHAWGSSIVTTGFGDLYSQGTPQTEYTASFSGTSGASPMVTGSALCLQGIAEANLGLRLDPITLRALIHNTGVPHLDPNKEIGPRPDLGAAINALLNSAAIFERGDLGNALRLTVDPNPTPAGAEIRFVSPNDGDLRLALFDATGRCVRLLAPRRLSTDAVGLTWDGRDSAGRPLASGVYYLRAQQGATRAARTILLAR
jgi:hypothetical protein